MANPMKHFLVLPLDNSVAIIYSLYTRAIESSYVGRLVISSQAPDHQAKHSRQDEARAHRSRDSELGAQDHRILRLEIFPVSQAQSACASTVRPYSCRQVSQYGEPLTPLLGPISVGVAHHGAGFMKRAVAAKVRSILPAWMCQSQTTTLGKKVQSRTKLGRSRASLRVSSAVYACLD